LNDDSDSDGINDNSDNCPYVSNVEQADSGGVDTATPDGIGDACQCGDMNGDGLATNTDSVLIRRNLLGLVSPFNADLCDVNGDGSCSNTDSVIIKRALLGLPPGVSQVCAAANP
ncbi:MAG: dockerin type I repeat-containing protein, partial [Pseudomonadales bacterium]